MQRSQKASKIAKVGTLTATAAATMLMTAGVGSADSGSTGKTQMGDIPCSYTWSSVPSGQDSWGNDVWDITVTPQNCDEPVQNGMEIKMTDSWKHIPALHANPSGTVSGGQAVIEDVEYGYLPDGEQFYVDDNEINIDVPWK